MNVPAGRHSAEYPYIFAEASGQSGVSVAFNDDEIADNIPGMRTGIRTLIIAFSIRITAKAK